jgi:hypothetical protein
MIIIHNSLHIRAEIIRAARWQPGADRLRSWRPPLAPPSRVMNSRLFTRSPRRRGRVPTKSYGESPEAEKRYSPAVCIGARKAIVEGDPDPNHISTSFAERQNLNVRMHTRRFTRLTNAFSKKVENHAHAVALFALYYNFVRVHKTLRMTPAITAK